MDGDVADAGSGGEDEGQIRGLEKTEEGQETISFYDLELVFL